MKRSAEASAEVSDATTDVREPLVKKKKNIEDLSSDDEYTSDYITGHFVKRRKKHQANKEKLLAAKGRKNIPITYTSTSTVSAISTFAPIRTPTGFLHTASIMKPIPTVVLNPVPTSVLTDNSLINKSILKPSSSSMFKPIPKRLHSSLLNKEAVMIAPLKKVEKRPVCEFSQIKRSRNIGPLDTLQLIRNAELKYLRLNKNEEPKPIENTPAELPQEKRLRKEENVGSPVFTFRKPIPLKDIDIHYLDSEEYVDTLKNITPEKIEQTKNTVEIDIQTDDVIIQEADGNHLTCSGCNKNLTTDNPKEYVVKCQKCLQNELPTSTNVINPKTRTDETKYPAMTWVCNKCNISKDEINKEKEEEVEQQAVKNSVPKIPDVDIPKNITPAQKMTNDIVPSLIAGEWTCEVCNSFNDELRARCFCCEAHKPGTNFLLDEVNKALKKRLESTTEEDEPEESAIIPLPDPVLYKPIPILPIRVTTTVSAPQLTPPVSPTLQTVPDIVPAADPEKQNEAIPATEALKLNTGMSMDEEPFPQTSVAKAPSPAPAVFSFGKSDETKELQAGFQSPVTKVPPVFTFGKPVETTETKPGFHSSPSKAPAVFTFGKLAETNELKPSFQPPTATVANTPGMFSFGKPAEPTKAIPSFQPQAVSPALFQFGSNQNDTSNMFGQQQQPSSPSPFTFTMGNTTQKQAANGPKYRNVVRKQVFGGLGQKLRNFPQVQNVQTPEMFEPPSPFGGAPMFSPPVQNNIMSTQVSTNTMMASPMQRSISFGNIAPVAPMPQPTSKPAFNFGTNEPNDDVCVIV